MSCPFCTLPADRIVQDNEHAIWIFDGFPVSPGHSLIIPKRHVGSFFEVSTEERMAMLALLDRAKAVVEVEYRPNAYNIGINDGPAAGQTVPHLQHCFSLGSHQRMAGLALAQRSGFGNSLRSWGSGTRLLGLGWLATMPSGRQF